MRGPPLLFLTQRIPYPPDKGEKIRFFRVLEHFAASHSVHLGCLVDDQADWAHTERLRALCADAHFAPLDRRVARVACLRGLLTGAPLSAVYFRNRGLADWVAGVLDRVRPATIVVCSSNMAPYVLDRPEAAGANRIVDLTDVDSEKWRAYAERARGPMRWLYRREWQRMAALERAIGAACDACTFVSESEAALYRRVAPAARARVRAVANGVDCAYFDPALDHARPFDDTAANFVFTGTMDYPPNEDAAVWFARDILPAIRRAVPGARFHVVGANPSPPVRALSTIEGVSVTGRVPDVRPYVAHATACVAPLRIARGIQNKVLEAMAMARPVIVTPGALEGIDAAPGRELLLAADAEAFAGAAADVALGRAPAGIGAAARARVLADYGWDARMRGFDRLFEPAAPPQAPAAREPEIAR